MTRVECDHDEAGRPLTYDGQPIVWEVWEPRFPVWICVTAGRGRGCHRGDVCDWCKAPVGVEVGDEETAAGLVIGGDTFAPTATRRLLAVRHPACGALRVYDVAGDDGALVDVTTTARQPDTLF